MRAKWIGSLLPLRTTIPATLHFSVLRFEAAGFGVSCPEAADEMSKPIRRMGYARCRETSHPAVYRKKYGESSTRSAEGSFCLGCSMRPHYFFQPSAMATPFHIT